MKVFLRKNKKILHTFFHWSPYIFEKLLVHMFKTKVLPVFFFLSMDKAVEICGSSAFLTSNCFTSLQLWDLNLRTFLLPEKRDVPTASCQVSAVHLGVGLINYLIS